MKIREAKIEDLKKVEGLYQELLEIEAEKYQPSIVTTWPFSKFGEEHFIKGIKEKDWYTIVCEEKDELIGFLTGSYMVSEVGMQAEKGRRTAKLNHIYIKKQFRDHGLGSKLSNDFKKWAKKKGANKIRVIPFFDNKEAINFYKEQGFENYTVNMEESI